MFSNMFGKKAPLRDDATARLLRLEAPAFVDFVRQWVHSEEPAAAAMCVVALQNFDVILKVVSEHDKRTPGSPPLIDEIINSLSRENDQRLGADNHLLPLLSESDLHSERNRRRLHWFLWAALVRRATSMAENDPRAHDDAAAIWVRLAEGGKYLAVLLKDSIIWDDDEKLWFSYMKSQKDGAFFVVNIMSPAWLRMNDQINVFADAHGFFAL